MRKLPVVIAIVIVIIFAAVVLTKNTNNDKSYSNVVNESYTPPVEMEEVSGSSEGSESMEGSVNDLEQGITEQPTLDTSMYEVPEVIAESQVWKDFLDSEYYTGQNFVFHDDGDRIVTDFIGDTNYVYVEYVFDKLRISVYDTDGVEIIARFE